MAKYTIDSTTLTNIGDAIRGKTQTSAGITPLDMPNAINSIPTYDNGDAVAYPQSSIPAGAQKVYTEQVVSDIAEALQQKTGTSEGITINQYVDKINSIPVDPDHWEPLNNGKTNCWFKIPEGGRTIAIKLQATSSDSSILVEWGDGSSETYTVGTKAISVTHFYNVGGTFIASISGKKFKLPSSFITTRTDNEYLLMPYIEIAHPTASLPFDNNYGIQKVAIMDGCTEIGDEAFDQARNLNYVQFEERTTSLSLTGNYHFSGCTSLKELILPEGIISDLPNHLVAGCTKLTKIKLPEDIAVYESGDHFINCKSLTSITIPSCVTTINTNTNPFTGSNLETIIFKPTTPPASGGNLALPQPYSMYIVPTESLDAYKAADKFSVVADRIFPEGQRLYSTFGNINDVGSIYSYTASENCTFDIGEYTRGYTNTASSEGFISVKVNGTEVYNKTLGTQTYDLLDNFTPTSLSAGDVVTIDCHWTGSHNNCYFYLFAKPTIS